VSEIAQTYQWIIATCKADAQLVAASTGGVWNGNADIGTLNPYTYVGRQSGSDTLTMNAVRLFAYELIQIKAVGPVSNYAALVTIANRIDALFGRASSIALSSGGVLACYRDGEIAYDEPVSQTNGVQWSHLGGLYRIALQGV